MYQTIYLICLVLLTITGKSQNEEISLAIITLTLSNLTIESSNIKVIFSLDINLNLNLNTAHAAGEIEIITVSAQRYQRPDYHNTLAHISVGSYCGDDSEQLERAQRQMEEDIAEVFSLQPSGCDLHNLPPLAPDGCSSEFGGVDFF